MTILIAVTCDQRAGRPAEPSSDAAPTRIRPRRPEIYVGSHVVEAIRRSGAEPLLLPPHDGDVGPLIERVLEICAGVVITGGAFDIHPAHYGQQIQARIDRVDEARTGLELALAGACLDRDVPLLGICGGMQALAVAAGGTLFQDIGSQITHAGEHEQLTDPATAWHAVELIASQARDCFGASTIQVNSTHHQAVDSPGALRIVGQAPDGVVEVVEHPDRTFCMGLQWHPELLHIAPFQGLVQSIRRARGITS